MKDRSSPTRSQAHEIAIDASEEAVWKAIADGEELTRWFVARRWAESAVLAVVRRGRGGQGADAPSSRIDVWEPNQRLRVTLMPFEMGKATRRVDGDCRRYTIERRDGKPCFASWNRAFRTPRLGWVHDGTGGWPQFFRTLRRYLERHAGKPRTTINIVGKLPDRSRRRERLTDQADSDSSRSPAVSARSGAGDTFSARSCLPARRRRCN
jgi:uncharacterized protein YndB with AHSA1/START domain